MCRQMNMRVTEAFLLTNNEVVGAWFPKNKRLHRNASHTDFGISDHDADLESGAAIHDILGDNLQKHMSLFQHKRFHIERSVPEQALCGLGNLRIVVGHILGREKRAYPVPFAANEKFSALK